MPPKASRRTASLATMNTTPIGLLSEDASDNNLDQTTGNLGYNAQPDYPSPASQSDEPSFESLGNLGRRVNKLVSAINKLESLGIDKSVEIPLPKIVVVGEQSAGKSSQIEALSEIKVPRAGGGACTRCVLHISLKTSSSQTWTCNIVLQKRYSWDKHSQTNEISRDQMGPWRRNDSPDEIPFATIYDKNDLDLCLKRAQRALLNPGKDAASFLRVPAADFQNQTDLNYEVVQTMFSPNVIHLEISAPNLPSLSFYDLPGIISQWDDERETYIPVLIQSLVEMYVEEDNSIVMLAFPATTDVVVSQAGALVKQLSAMKRTIGVMTKPDRLQASDDIAQWEKIIAGRGSAFRLGHGCYATRQPNPQELARNISTTEARKIEADFFARNPPWNTHLALYQGQFGTYQLRDKLSQLLAQQISKVLPNIKQTISDRLTEVDKGLRDLPKPLAENSFTIVSTLVEHFSNSLRAAFSGESHLSTSDDDNLSSNWKKSVEGLRRSVLGSKPVIVVRGAVPEAGWHKHVTNTRERPIDVDDEPVEPSSNRKRQQMAPPTTPSKRLRVDASSTPTPSPGGRSENTPIKKERTKKQYTDKDTPTAMGHRYTLEGLQTTLTRMTTSNVADEVDSKAKENLMLQSMQPWRQCMGQYIHETSDLVKHLVGRLLEEHLRMHSRTRLDQEMRKAAHTYLVQLTTDFAKKLEEILEIELHKPTTFNADTRRNYREREYQKIMEQRMKKRAMHFIAYTEKQDERANSDSIQSKAESMVRDQKKYAELGIEPFQRELNAIADIRAYYFVAADSFIDNVAKLTEYHLFRNCREHLVEPIRKNLRLHSEDGFAYAKVLLAEDAGREERRHRLQAERSRLVQALQSIEGLCDPDVEMQGAEDEVA